MKKYIILLIVVLNVSLCQGQVIKSFQNETRISFDDLGEISLNQTLKLKDLYLMDKDFKGLESLGTPIDIKYENQVVSEHWVYVFKNLRLEYVNTGGVVEIAGIIMHPAEESTVKFGNTVLSPKTEIEQLVSKNSSGKILTDQTDELKVKVFTEKVELGHVRFKILLNKNSNKIKSIQIYFRAT